MAGAASPRATVIVPTFNEAENVVPLTGRILAAAHDVEIVFVDDASSDGTPRLVRTLAARLPVRLVERSDERGLATAVLRGFREARTDLVVVLDADLSHPPELIPALLAAVEEGAGVAVGSRYVPGGAIDDWPVLRRAASKAGTWLARPLTPVHDPMAGFFALRKSLIEGVELKPRGFKILLEILARARPSRVVEVPIEFGDRKAGFSKFGGRERRDFLRQVWTLYRETNAWPWRMAKFLGVGATGMAVHLGVLAGLVECLRQPPLGSAVGAFIAAMTSNFLINRAWTFDARDSAVASSYVKYAAGAVGGLLVQLLVMHLLQGIHYGVSASVGIVLGTVFTFLASQRWAFTRRRTVRFRIGP